MQFLTYSQINVRKYNGISKGSWANGVKTQLYFGEKKQKKQKKLKSTHSFSRIGILHALSDGPRYGGKTKGDFREPQSA